MKTIGSRAEVMHNTAKRTSGGLAKADLMYNKHGRIVSRAKHNTAKREMRLVKYGYTAKKGKFGYVKTTPAASKTRTRGRKSRRSRMNGGAGLEPADVNSSFMIKEVRAMPFSPLDRALVGGRRRSRRSRRRGHRGGSNIYNNTYSPASLSGNGIDGQGITNYASAGSNSVQLAAGMAGGRRRRRHRRGHRGGTGKPHMMLGAPLSSALNAAS